ncbi:MAG: glycosyltransferase involved in cell wall biosynthesis [Pseudohongiellaceae bacterium]|jgi:glycosyltransferase involved in cell wall biosynthesis
MPLRFCLITTFYPPYHFGGDGVCVYRLAESLARRGHKVDVIHSIDAYHLGHPAEPEIAFEHHPNVTVHGLRSSMPVLASLSVQQLGRPAVYGKTLRALIDEQDYDVIHYHNVSLMGGPGVLRNGRALKLYTAHEYWLICPTHVLFRNGEEACTQRTCWRCTLKSHRPPQLWRSTGFTARCTRHVDLFLMPSRFAMERHHRDGLQRPMTVLPHFAPEPAEQPNAPSPQDDEALPRGPEGLAQAMATASDSRPYFLFVGRLEKLKGVHELLRLFASYDKARLLIVGDGDQRAELEAQASDLEQVSFLGSVHPSQLVALYRGALAVLVPSLCYEAFNLIPIEAFAQGTPAIVRDLGATPELVRDSGAGFTFETLEQCAEAMERLRNNGALRAELGRKARAAWEERWTEEVHMERYLAIVDSMLAGEGPPS